MKKSTPDPSVFFKVMERDLGPEVEADVATLKGATYLANYEVKFCSSLQERCDYSVWFWVYKYYAICRLERESKPVT